MVEIRGTHPFVAMLGYPSPSLYVKPQSNDSARHHAKSYLDNMLRVTGESLTFRHGERPDILLALWLRKSGHLKLVRTALREGPGKALSYSQFLKQATVFPSVNLSRGSANKKLTSFRVGETGETFGQLVRMPEVLAIQVESLPRESRSAFDKELAYVIRIMSDQGNLPQSGKLIAVGTFDECDADLITAKIPANDTGIPYVPGAVKSNEPLVEQWYGINAQLEARLNEYGIESTQAPGLPDMSAIIHVMCHLGRPNHDSRFIVSAVPPHQIPPLSERAQNPNDRYDFGLNGQVFSSFDEARRHIETACPEGNLKEPGAYVYVISAPYLDVQDDMNFGVAPRDWAGGIRVRLCKEGDSVRSEVCSTAALAPTGRLWTKLFMG